MKVSGRKGLGNLTLLFVSKAGGVLVMLYFMPLFYRLLGVEQFGMVAVILSLQAFLMMLDLGMSTIVGRDVAVFGNASRRGFTAWRNAETILTIFYFGILLLAAAWTLTPIPKGLTLPIIVAVVMLFWVLVLQNLGQTILLGLQAFKSASLIQLFGALIRAAVTALALQHLSATLAVFVFAQLSTALLQLIVTRAFCHIVLKNSRFKSVEPESRVKGCIDLLKRGKPLFIFGLAGAAVMQLDKPIIATFISAKEVSTYFLAVTFCMTPIAVLAAPVSQYFQPIYISRMAQSDEKETQRLFSIFVYTLVSITTLASSVLWFYRALWIKLWLGSNPALVNVVTYVTVLMPGVVIGALGYIPFAMLTAQQDYHFQARISASMSVVMLLLVVYFSSEHSVYAICWVYAAYHILSTAASWARATSLEQTRLHAKTGFITSSKLLLSIVAVTYLVKISLFRIDKVEYQLAAFLLIMCSISLLALFFFSKIQRTSVVNKISCTAN